jgi:hypothetical protein
MSERPKPRVIDGISPEPYVLITEGEDVERSKAKYTTVVEEIPKPMDEAAYYGPIGEAVRLMAEFSEACPEALLVQSLVMFGSAMGRTGYVASGVKLFSNEFVVLVGDTGVGRKGTALDMCVALFEAVAPNLKTRKTIQSGEAIIHAVRDERFGQPKNKCLKSREDYEKEKVLVDVGESDKSVLFYETEFSSLLKIAQRNGNIITEVLRDAWDSPAYLQNSNKNSPDKATGPHISLAGHTTREEQNKTFQSVDRDNGFGNRILWVRAYKAKSLPDLDELLNWNEYPALIGKFKNSLLKFRPEFGFKPKNEVQLKRDVQAQKLYRSFKEESETKQRSENVKKVLNREPQHVLKLSLIYAAIDGGDEIRREHMEAAIAVVRYCEASAIWAFGDSTGNATANKMLNALRFANAPLSKNDVRNELSRHVSSVDLDEAIGLLVRSNLVNVAVRRSANGQKVDIFSLPAKT